MNVASLLYGAVATWRRRWYGRDPARRRRLRRPVVSVGNLRVGGSGKTPVVECIARMLVEQGERPAVLSRGYGRALAQDGVTVVSDGRTILAGFDTAGDEPLMLARALPTVPVLVGGDRYLSGRLAEDALGVTVHLLDDGFQHLELERDVDLLVTGEGDLIDRPMPAGRLREPLAAAALADAALVTAGDAEAADRVGRALGLTNVFRVARTIGVPRMVTSRAEVLRHEPVFGMAGIARPDLFFTELATAGWRVVGTQSFRDHHWFTARDISRVSTAARAAGATVVLTTEKDAVRLESAGPGSIPVAAVPLNVTVEPADEFGRWLGARLDAARTQHEHEQQHEHQHRAPSTEHAVPDQ